MHVKITSIFYESDHSSEIRGLHSMKCSSKTLQNEHRPGHSLGKNIKLHEMKNEEKTWVFLYIKYSKF